MADAGENQEQKQKTRSPVRVVIWICVSLAFVVIVGVFVKVLFFPPPPESFTTTAGPAQQSVTGAPGAMVEIDEFLTNLAKPDTDTYISVRVAVELEAAPNSREAADITAEINSRKIEIKQVVEEVLQSRNREELSSESGRQGLRQEIQRKINARLTKGRVRNVLTYNMLFS